MILHVSADCALTEMLTGLLTWLSHQIWIVRSESDGPDQSIPLRLRVLISAVEKGSDGLQCFDQKRAAGTRRTWRGRRRSLRRACSGRWRASPDERRAVSDAVRRGEDEGDDDVFPCVPERRGRKKGAAPPPVRSG